MSDRPYPKILRTTEAADATLRTYARGAHLAPFEALILAIGLLRTKDEREAASERAYKFAALWHDLARKLWHRWRSGLWALAREQNAADGLRRELESAREATRRADAEVERLTVEATVRAREYAAAAAKLGTETERLQRELAASQEAHALASTERDDLRIQVVGLGRTVDAYSATLAKAKRTADKLRLEVERVTEERDTERRLDVAAQEALRADVAREIETNRKLEAELAETRAALATKGAAALPDDFEAKIAERAPGWKGTLPELRARVITLGFSRYDALATDAAKRAAERGR